MAELDCPNCSARVGGGDQFCRRCGARLKSEISNLGSEQPRQSAPRLGLVGALAHGPSGTVDEAPKEERWDQRNDLAIAGALIFFMGLLISLAGLPPGVMLALLGLIIWIIGAVTRKRG